MVKPSVPGFRQVALNQAIKANCESVSNRGWQKAAVLYNGGYAAGADYVGAGF